MKPKTISCLCLVIIMGLIFPVIAEPLPAHAAPAREPLYYLSIPEDDALQMFRDDGGASATSPVRSVTSIAIGTNGTLVYYDHWENGFVADIINEAELVWGDSNLANGCPPKLNNTPNPCLVSTDDSLQVGDVIVLDNYVVVDGSSGSYYRDASKVFFDGRDKLVTTYPTTVSRAMWPSGPGSLQAGGIEVFPTVFWGTQYVSPMQEDASAPGVSTGLFEDVGWFILAGAGGATIDVDANGDGDLLDANDLDDYAMAEGDKRVVNNIQWGATLSVVSGNPVQVNVLYADTADTYEMRWSALIPRNNWSNDYYSAVGTNPTAGTGCTVVWLYNPGTSPINVNYAYGNGANGSISVGANANVTSPPIPLYSGAHFFTADPSEVFLPFSVTDCSGGGQIMDWDTPLFATNQLTPDLLIGWAPGCTDESHLGVCRDADGSPNLANSRSRSVIWVTSLANTTVYVDTDGSGIACPAGVGAEQAINTIASMSYRIDDDPTSQNNVRHEFATSNYAANGPNNSQNWSTAWIESGDDGSASNGSIRISGGYLQLRNSGTEAGDTIQRSRDLTGQTFARFSFQILSTTPALGEDRIVTEVSPDGGANWYLLEVFDGPTALVTKVYNISPYISNNTAIRFRFLDNLETGDLWQIDNVNIQYAPDGDFDMTGSYLQTCDGTKLAVTYGQLPSRSESGDNEALDLGTVIVPYLIPIDASLDKQVSDDTPDVGGTVTFSLLVNNASGVNTATNLEITDVLSAGYSYLPGSIGGGDVQDDSDPGGTGLNWLISSLLPGNTITLTYQAVILGNASSYDNYAEITDADQPDLDSDPGDGSTDEDDDDVVIVTPNAVIGDLVWLDLNGDGIQNVGETGLHNVVVRLFRNEGSLFDTALTNASGNYSFSSVPAGSYYLVFDLPVGYFFSPGNQGSDDGMDSDPDPITGQTSILTVGSGVVDQTWDAGLIPASSVVGDTIWLDENGDGVQDAGESGITNVLVNLIGTDIYGNPVALATYSDADGHYVFNVPAGTYTVHVDPATLPAGLAANPTFDFDGIGTPNTAAVAVLINQEMMLVDFGYNWVSPGDSFNPPQNATGAIGDHLWIDANGNGFKDTEEAGMAGVLVELYTDLDGDGIYDSLAGSTLTDNAGSYIFEDLPSGAYVVLVNGGTAPAGFTHSGDPDQSGGLCTTCDNRTTSAIILGPGDVYLNADFGYLPSSGHTIGDTIYLDLNGSGGYDAGEPGIPGVSVALIRDTNGDGIWDANGVDNLPGTSDDESIIATDVSDLSGLYSFPGLPDGNYLVWVNDIANVLGDLNQSGDPDSILDNRSVVTISGADRLDQDFGYTSPNHGAGDGLIGDTIFLDRNGNDSYDPGERLEGVQVRLFVDTDGNGVYDSGEPQIAATFTDENGNYYFGNLPANQYIVQVDVSSLPAGVSNSVDPDGGSANESAVTLSNGQINLNQDFGYQPSGTPNSISGTVWEDSNANGLLEGNEPDRFGGVPIVLYDSNGNIVASTTTDGMGNYYFDGLPDGSYWVDVLNKVDVLEGYWHSVGPNAGNGVSDDNSQIDPYPVTLSGGVNHNLGDFGYYHQPSQVGNLVWLDRDNDGQQDGDEPGIPGVRVILTITYPNGDTTTAVTMSGSGGVYHFGNLLLDENYNGEGTNEPVYTVGINPPPGVALSPENASGNNDEIDGDSDGIDEIITVIQGESDPSYDFGFYTSLLDLGDLPENLGGLPDYPTLFSPGAAAIVFSDGADPDTNPDTTDGVPAVWLGATVDTEPDGQPSANAQGDGDDEDGLAYAQHGWLAGQTAVVTTTLNSSESGATVYFGLWIDWNANGSLDDIGDGFYSGSGLTGSPVNLPVNISVPMDYLPNSDVYIRLRASDMPLTRFDLDGLRVNGEVEDYLVRFSPTAIGLTSLQAKSSPTGYSLYARLGTLLLFLTVGIVFVRIWPRKT